MLKGKAPLQASHVRITSELAATEQEHEDGSRYTNASLHTRGGVYIEKGLRIGNQDQMCNGMLFYDGENFYGHSEKFGTCLLSNHSLSSELSLPTSIFENMTTERREKKHLITAAQNNLTRQSTQREEEGTPAAAPEEKLIKNIIVDITMKDVRTFYMIIPQIYQNTNFHLNLVVTFHFDESTYIHDATIHVINQTNKELSVSSGNDERAVYYEKEYSGQIAGKTVGLYQLKRITNQYLLMKSEFYKRE